LPPEAPGVRERIVALDKRRVWHPYTEMQRYRERVEPFVIARAEGSRIYDLDGRCYLDGNASWWTATLGHGHPRLVEALRRQAGTLCHTALAGIAHQHASELAEAICGVAPEGLGGGGHEVLPPVLGAGGTPRAPPLRGAGGGLPR
jgi:adenosylmethionine-8-amino-7-oxononanoate aminotransferase